MEQARAAALLSSTDASEADRLAAVAVLRARGDTDSAQRCWPRCPASRRRSPRRPAAAMAAIDRDRSSSGASLQSVYYGLSLGSVLLLAAAGLAITFGVMGVINMAHGEMVMIGAYTTFVVQQVMPQPARPACSAPACSSPCRWPSWSPASLGIAIERSLIRWLYGRPLETLLATWGLSLVLQQAVRSIFGADQPGGRHARLDERRDQTRRPDAHLEPAVHHRLRASWCWPR